MKIAVIGGQNHMLTEGAAKTLGRLLESGMSEMVSRMRSQLEMKTVKWAKKNKVLVKVFSPQWDVYGVSAETNRDQEVVNYADKVLVISPGSDTRSIEAMARRLNKPIVYVRAEGKE